MEKYNIIPSALMPLVPNAQLIFTKVRPFFKTGHMINRSKMYKKGDTIE
jgi:hypothetical protein